MAVSMKQCLAYTELASESQKTRSLYAWLMSNGQPMERDQACGDLVEAVNVDVLEANSTDSTLTMVDNYKEQAPLHTFGVFHMPTSKKVFKEGYRWEQAEAKTGMQKLMNQAIATTAAVGS